MLALIEKFSTYLADERNLSPHTRVAYLRDLSEFQNFLELHGGSDKEALNRLDSLLLRRYLAELHKRNQRTSIARKLSTLRTFFRYMVYVITNPCAADLVNHHQEWPGFRRKATPCRHYAIMPRPP